VDAVSTQPVSLPGHKARVLRMMHREILLRLATEADEVAASIDELGGGNPAAHKLVLAAQQLREVAEALA
jgi:hypothetical protein